MTVGESADSRAAFTESCAVKKSRSERERGGGGEADRSQSQCRTRGETLEEERILDYTRLTGYTQTDRGLTHTSF